MASKTKTAEEQAAALRMRELRARDAALAMQEYQQEQLAVRARTERLRALRLSRDSQVSGERTSDACGKQTAGKERLGGQSPGKTKGGTRHAGSRSR